MGGMTLWVSYSNPFWRLDRYINNPSTTAKDLEDRFRAPQPAFSQAAPQINIDGTQPTATIGAASLQKNQTHFEKHWIGTPGTVGGDYWPYIDKLDVQKLLHCALETATGIIAQRMPSKRKTHITLWICSQSYGDTIALKPPSPPGYDIAKQAQLFRAAVLEFDDVVQTVISTPEPNPTIIGDEARDIATAAGEEVAYPIPHYRIQPYDADQMEWVLPADVINGNDAVPPAIPPDATCVRVQVLAPVPPLSLEDDEFSSVASCAPVGYQLSFPTAEPQNYRIRTSR